MNAEAKTGESVLLDKVQLPVWIPSHVPGRNLERRPEAFEERNGKVMQHATFIFVSNLELLTKQTRTSLTDSVTVSAPRTRAGF